MQLPALSLVAAVLASVGHAQGDRSLRFAWPEDAHAIVTNENFRGEKSFTLRFELRARAGEASEPSGEPTIVLTRSGSRVTHWNGKPVPESKRPILAPQELSMDLLPAWIVAADGSFVGVESHAAFEVRVEQVAEAWAGDDRQRAQVAQRSVASTVSATRYALLAIQAERQWDEWVGRWRALDFTDKDSDSFEGQIQLAMTGDLVDGRFDVEHAGPDPDREDHSRLRIDFAASGAKLDAAAIRRHRELFGESDEPFEAMSMTVSEHTSVVTATKTLLPAQIESNRSTIVRAGDEERRFAERRSWTFAWQ